MAALSFTRFGRLAVIMAGLALLGACSQKATALKITVDQFGAATETAFSAYGDAHSAQFSPVTKSEDEMRREFIANLDAFNGMVTPDNLPILMDPDAVKIDPALTRQWQATLYNLRQQYRQFAAIFERITEGSALGAGAVKDSGPILTRLRQQLSAITGDISANPPQYLVRRSTLIARLNTINRTAHAGDGRTLRQQAWWQEWHGLMEQERRLQAETLRSFVTASQLGEHLQAQIDNYNRLDIQELIGAAQQGIALAGKIHTMSTQDLVFEGHHLAGLPIDRSGSTARATAVTNAVTKVPAAPETPVASTATTTAAPGVVPDAPADTGFSTAPSPAPDFVPEATAPSTGETIQDTAMPSGAGSEP